jgi:DNA polymerase-3 subunit epsilon
MPVPTSLDAFADALLQAVPDAAFVCAADGRVLRANAAAAELTGGDLSGRSVFEVVDEALVRAARDGEPFATRVGGRLVDVRRATSADGFVLVLCAAAPPALRRDAERLALDLTESVRGPLASIRAAVETLTEYPEMDEAVAAQFTTIIHEQALALGRQLEEAAAALAEITAAQRPLEHLRADVLLDRAAVAVRRAVDVPVDVGAAAPLVVRADWDGLGEGLVHLATRVVHAVRAERLTLRLGTAGQMAALDIVWTGPAVRPERLARWAEEPLGQEGAAAETLGDVVERHGGEVWAREADAEGRAAVRVLLPVTER